MKKLTFSAIQAAQSTGHKVVCFTATALEIKTLVIHALSLLSAHQRLVLVIVPTIGLAIEQATRMQDVLRSAGKDHGDGYAWHSGLSAEEREVLRERLATGTQRVLFCSPESATQSLLPQLFRSAASGQLDALVIDEAHLVDQWGAEFLSHFMS